MEVIWGLKNIKKRYRYLILTLGSFDGMHIGHQKVIRIVVERARQVRGTSMVLTFHPHPRQIVNSGNSPPLLTSTHQKIKLLERLGVKVCLIVDFDEHLARMSPEQFVIEILHQLLRVREVFAGSDYLFGWHRAGNMDFLTKMGKRYDFKVHKVRSLSRNGKVVSSTRIRKLIHEGELNEAAKLLGRPYSIVARVEKGRRVAKQTGYPTANIRLKDEVSPPEGAYAAWVRLNHRIYPGALGVLEREGQKIVEVHLIDFQKDIYGSEIEVIFHRRLREKREFCSQEEARRQIERDTEKARRILCKSLSAPPNG